MRKYLIIAALFLVLALPAKADITTGLVLWYTFDSNDISGTSVTDVSGNGITGTTVNSPKLTRGVLGQALAFDGSTQYGTFSSFTGFPSGAANRTMSVWMYPTSYNAAYSVAFAYGGGVGSAGKNSGVILDPSGNIYIWGYGSADFATGINVPLNKWSLVTFTYNGTTDVVYLNGVSVATASRSLTTATNCGTFGLSDEDNQGACLNQTNYWPGSLDDIRLYNRVLSAGDVRQLYYQGLHRHFNWIL